MASKTFGTLFRSKDQQEGSLWRGKGEEGGDGSARSVKVDVIVATVHVSQSGRQ